MGRRVRLASPAATYHVMARGNDRTAIYLDDEDRLEFLRAVGRVIGRRRWTCLSFCLMGNHFHLLLATLDASLSEGMRDLLGRYARAFNRRHDRRGHLFRERFLSVPVTDDIQYAATVRYIARNPVEAGLVTDAVDWPWSSTGAILGTSPAPDWFDADAVVSAFGPDAPAARRSFRELVSGEPGLEHEVPDDLVPLPATPRSAVVPPAEDVLRLRGPDDGLLTCIELGYSHAEIAEALGLTRSAVTHRLRVLRRR